MFNDSSDVHLGFGFQEVSKNIYINMNDNVLKMPVTSHVIKPRLSARTILYKVTKVSKAIKRLLKFLLSKYFEKLRQKIQKMWHRVQI
jgi:hypothetical protein